jgi:hypothetical protein
MCTMRSSGNSIFRFGPSPCENADSSTFAISTSQIAGSIFFDPARGHQVPLKSSVNHVVTHPRPHSACGQRAVAVAPERLIAGREDGLEKFLAERALLAGQGATLGVRAPGLGEQFAHRRIAAWIDFVSQLVGLRDHGDAVHHRVERERSSLIERKARSATTTRSGCCATSRAHAPERRSDAKQSRPRTAFFFCSCVVPSGAKPNTQAQPRLNAYPRIGTARRATVSWPGPFLRTSGHGAAGRWRVRVALRLRFCQRATMALASVRAPSSTNWRISAAVARCTRRSISFCTSAI